MAYWPAAPTHAGDSRSVTMSEALESAAHGNIEPGTRARAAQTVTHILKHQQHSSPQMPRRLVDLPNIQCCSWRCQKKKRRRRRKPNSIQSSAVYSRVRMYKTSYKTSLPPRAVSANSFQILTPHSIQLSSHPTKNFNTTLSPPFSHPVKDALLHAEHRRRGRVPG